MAKKQDDTSPFAEEDSNQRGEGLALLSALNLDCPPETDIPAIYGTLLSKFSGDELPNHLKALSGEVGCECMAGALARRALLVYLAGYLYKDAIQTAFECVPRERREAIASNAMRQLRVSGPQSGSRIESFDPAHWDLGCLVGETHDELMIHLSAIAVHVNLSDRATQVAGDLG